MTTKRFTLIECNGNIEDGYTQSVYDGGEDVFELLYLLNELYEENNEEELDYFKSKCGSLEEKLFYINRENEQLKFQLQNTSDQRDEFHRGARENANRVGKLEKENEQLKKDVDKYNKKIEIMANAFLYAEDLIDVEQVFFTEVYEPSENFDEELLCEFSNLFFSDYLSNKKVE